MPGNRSDHWAQYSNPAGWFLLRYPPSWRLREEAGAIRLEAPDDGGILTIRYQWLEETSNTPVEQLIDLDTLFPQRRRVRKLKKIDMEASSAGFEGETEVRLRNKWWHRFWSPRRWQSWRVWSLRFHHIWLSAVYIQAEQRDPESQSIAGMILNTLTFSEEPVDPPERFTQRVLELVHQKFPDLEVEALPDFRLLIGESHVNLFNFYRAYVRAPSQFEEIVLPALTTVLQVQGWGEEQLEPPLERVRDRIMPMLYPSDVWHEQFPGFVGEEWIAGLATLFVVDESQAYWYISEKAWRNWNITLDELHDIAIRNLDRYFEEAEAELTLVGEEDGPRFLLPVKPDAYNGSRFLSPTFRARMQEVLGREFAAGIPGRDVFVAVTLDLEAAVEQVRDRVAEDYQTVDHPLCQQMLLITTDGVSELP